MSVVNVRGKKKKTRKKIKPLSYKEFSILVCIGFFSVGGILFLFQLFLLPRGTPLVFLSDPMHFFIIGFCWSVFYLFTRNDY